MTTFIDYRYSTSGFSKLGESTADQENEISLSIDEDSYIAWEYPINLSPQVLFQINKANSDKVYVQAVLLSGHLIEIQDANGETLLKSLIKDLSASKSGIFCLRIGTTSIGLKTHTDKIETSYSQSLAPSFRPVLITPTSHTGKLMGYTYRKHLTWARIFYQREKVDGICIELIMDWHHLSSGIPHIATVISEIILDKSIYQVRFSSYSMSKKESESSDFYKLFSSQAPSSKIVLHITPTIYSKPVEGKFNIGFFVCETDKLAPIIVKRCNAMDLIVVPTTFVKTCYANAGVTCPIEIIQHGVFTDFFHPRHKKQDFLKNLGGRGFNFLAVSTHMQRKNIQWLVQAFFEEFRDSEDIALLLLQRAEVAISPHNVALNFTRWERMYYQNSAPILFSTEHLSIEELRDYYASADGYLMPSNEGFGLTLLEAMACGTPVIGLEWAGVKDFLNSSNGYLVKCGKSFLANEPYNLSYIGDRFYQPDIKHLRQQMRQVFEGKDETKKRALKARHDVKQDFTWDVMGEKLIRILNGTARDLLLTTENNTLRPYAVNSHPNFSWVLCVNDDEISSKTLHHLKKMIAKNQDVLCLFTSYANINDVMTARKLGFIYHLWDETFDNCISVAQNVLTSTWIGIIYPGEKIIGKSFHLEKELKQIDENYSDAFIKCSTGKTERRFLKHHSIDLNTQITFLRDWIGSSAVGYAIEENKLSAEVVKID